ncbi:hypothetical protein LMI01_11440 [Companilactobacillus mindensis]|nr:hypothetical protein LMI01_11440 [Companilactobacillus mindensis]
MISLFSLGLINLINAVKTAKIKPKMNEMIAKGMVYCNIAEIIAGKDVMIVCHMKLKPPQ